MTVSCKRIQVSTGGRGETINVTSEIAREVNNSGINSGVVTVFIPGSTAGITTVEFEPGLVADMRICGSALYPKRSTTSTTRPGETAMVTHTCAPRCWALP